ncbi:hypothetical protein H4219_005473 [Mycoemilia scoparia]|uniref:Glutathione S-transferase n=1 Tax=Mycoemilia scoparia TaxID=417184 RepID=A0A9W8DJT0_9FUNG|nr:hypothetical protein H4219_005473 [Mycoemilia scoparia]
MTSGSPSYELIYFDYTGLAEITRIMLTLAGADWKETNPEDWASLKPTMPFEHLPVLIERSEGQPDFILSESEVIERYIGYKYGFISSSDPKLSAKQEQIRAQFNDARLMWIEIQFYNGESTHRSRFEDQIKLLVRKHEEVLEKNGNTGHYFGNELTYPDISAYVIFGAFKQFGFDAEFTDEKAPNLSKLIKNVGKIVEEAKMKKKQ